MKLHPSEHLVKRHQQHLDMATGMASMLNVKAVPPSAEHVAEAICGVQPMTHVGQVMKVVCDETNNSPEDVAQSKLNIDIVQLKPAEYVEVKFVVSQDGPTLDEVLTSTDVDVLLSTWPGPTASGPKGWDLSAKDKFDAEVAGLLEQEKSDAKVVDPPSQLLHGADGQAS